MFLKFNKGKQAEIIELALTKAGSERKLRDAAGLSLGAIHRCKNELSHIRKDRLLKLLKFLNTEITQYENDIVEKIPLNFRQVKGGINRVEKSRENGTFQNSMEHLHEQSSKWTKNWHETMKQEKPLMYFQMQYEKFKKINGGYKFNLADVTPVRNQLEVDVGNFLISEKFGFLYEPLITIHGKAYFPDFMIKNGIIEATAWNPHKGTDWRLVHLQRKIADYIQSGYPITLFVPPKLRKFYKEMQCPVLSNFSDLQRFLTPS